MRVLWISSHLPYPPISGGRLREYELLRRLARYDDVHVVAVSEAADDTSHLEAFRRTCPTDLFPAEPDRDEPCHLVATHASAPATAAVRRLLPRADVVHVEGFHLMQHVPASSLVPITLIDQNIEYQLWEQRLALGQAGTQLDQQRILQEVAACRSAELKAWRRATLCATVTPEDAATMRAAAPDIDPVVIPDGCDHLAGAPIGVAPRPLRPTAAAPCLIFVANFAYEPNVDAAWLLLDGVLPRVRGTFPGATLDLVGNAPCPDLVARADAVGGVRVTGRVPDVQPFLCDADVAVCPLRVGGGIKVKVIEALVTGLPVVTTPVGAQGLPVGLGVPTVVAPDPRALAKAVIDVLSDPNARAHSQDAASGVTRILPSWDDAASRLRQAYEVAQQRAVSSDAG